MNETKYFVVWVTPAQYKQPAARSYLGPPWGPQWVARSRDAQRVDANAGRQIIARLEDEWRTKHSIPLGSYYELEQCKDESESRPVESKPVELKPKEPAKYVAKKFQLIGWLKHYRCLTNSKTFGFSDIMIFSDKDVAKATAGDDCVIDEISDVAQFEAELIKRKKETYWVTWTTYEAPYFEHTTTSSVRSEAKKWYLQNIKQGIVSKGEAGRWVDEKHKWSNALMFTHIEAQRTIEDLKRESRFLDSTAFKIEPYVDEPASLERLKQMPIFGVMPEPIEEDEDDEDDDDSNLDSHVDVSSNSRQDEDQSFRKDDGDKVRADLLPATALFEVAGVLTIGAAKYGANNWRNVDDVTRYKAAMMRHMLAYLSGEASDAETGLSHLAHAVCNAMFLMELDGDK